MRRIPQSLHKDENVNGGPTDDKDCHHHQNQPGDPTEVAIFLSGARKESDALQAQDHQGVADDNDDDRDHKGKDEDTDLHEEVPPGVIIIWELQGALNDIHIWTRWTKQTEAQKENLFLLLWLQSILKVSFNMSGYQDPIMVRWYYLM